MVARKTAGDRILDVSLSKIGDKGLFTRDLEAGLLSGELDFAVHSLKDVPTELPPGLAITCVLKRHDPADVLLSPRYASLAALPRGAKLGTSSLRRKSQLLHVRPDLEIRDLRGNLQTRLRKMEEEGFDGIVLAAAGLERMGLARHIRERLPFSVCLPAVCQGILCVESRSGDAEIADLLVPVHDAETALCAAAERALLAALEGGCQVPVAANARLRDGTLSLDGLVGALDGSRIVRRSAACALPDTAERGLRAARALGRQLAAELSEAGGAQILQEIRAGGSGSDRSETGGVS